MDKLKIGFIGCGGIARAHIRRLLKMDDVKPVAFTDINLSRAKNFAENFKGNPYTDYNKMIKNEDLDIVFICLPPFAHKDEVMVVAENNINIYIEKPIALNMDLARKMEKAVEKHGVKSQVGYQQRFSAGAERAKKLIENGEVGDIGLATGKYWCRFLRKDWWIDVNKSGGQIVEQSTHLYDLLRWLIGDVEKVYCELDKIFYKNIPNMSIEDVSSTILRFKSKAIGTITATIGAAPNIGWFKWKIVGSKVMLESDEPGTLKIYWNTTTPLRIEEHREIGRDPMYLNQRDLIQAVKEDGETRTPIKEGVKTLQLTLAAVESAREGKPIYLSQI